MSFRCNQESSGGRCFDKRGTAIATLFGYGQNLLSALWASLRRFLFEFAGCLYFRFPENNNSSWFLPRSPYLQRAFGYGLTGVTSEKVIFLLHGPKDSGKSTLLNVIRMLLGPFAVKIMLSSLLARNENTNAMADLADLRGARFAQTSETEEGQRLSEATLKRLSQGMGKIKSVRKYENPIEFNETHKLWIDANHLPDIQGSDDSIWERLHPVPFDTVIPKEKQQRELSQRLVEKEGAGILRWCVDGCLKWQKNGLQPPECVRIAREEWRDEADQVERWLAEDCERDPKHDTPFSFLFDCYVQWCKKAGEKNVKSKMFAQRLVAHGLTRIPPVGREVTKYKGVMPKI